MTIHFEGAHERRKELVQALADATGCKSEYLGAPDFGYRIGDYIVHRDGSVEADGLLDGKEIGIVLQALRGRGFIPLDNEWSKPEKAPTEQEMATCLSAPREGGIALSFPKDGLSTEAIANVKKLIAAKAPLIKLALEVDELPVEEEEDKLTFTWLPISAPSEMIDATARLLAAIIKLARKLRRVTVTERVTDNPRYAFRCFLLRLGFIGDEYKTVRKYLMKGVPGDGSKRHPVIEFDAATDAPSEETAVEVEILEKLDDAVIAEDAAASESVISEESENGD
jgi:hypothetical protein